MIQRLLLDRIDVLGDEFTVRVGIQGASPVFPDTADAELAVGNPAMVTAKEAGHSIVFDLLIKKSLFVHPPLLSVHRFVFLLYHSNSGLLHSKFRSSRVSENTVPPDSIYRFHPIPFLCGPR
jgi:hypothetical protein